MKRLGVPELLIIFTIMLLIFGPRTLPQLYQRIRPTRRREEEENAYPAWLNFAFGLVLVIAFLFGLFNTLRIFR